MVYLTKWRIAAGITALLLSSPALSADNAEKIVKERPNVLFIFVDDLRPQFGAYGHGEMHTPNIDRLAENGLTFTRAYSHWPACGPSRASILSGLRPDSVSDYVGGQSIRSIARDANSLPGHFKAQGYYTRSVGKIYHDRDADMGGWSEAPWHAKTAIDNWQGYVSKESHELRQRLWLQAREDNPDIELYQINGKPVESAALDDGEYGDGKTRAKAIQVLRDQANKPFFIAVGFEKPHFPFAAPQKYWDLYQRETLRSTPYSARPAGAADIPYAYSELHQYVGFDNRGPPSQEQALELIHGYYACVSFVDAQIGKLLSELDRLDLRKNTIVILVSDHGLQLGEQAVWGKHSLYETSLRTPMIISVPEQKAAGRLTDAIIEHVDIYPSLSDLAGLTPSAGLDGLSFAPLLQNPDLPGKLSAMSQYQHFKDPYTKIMGYSIRSDRFRYTEWRDDQQSGSVFARELYDLSSIASEQINIANDPQYAATVNALSKTIDKFP